jgi:hypothetical protein
LNKVETYISVFIKTLFRVLLLIIKGFVMKKQTVFTGIFSLILVFGLTLAGCPGTTNGGEGEETKMTKFEGTWRNQYGSHYTYTFTADTFTLKNDTVEPRTGIFTFTDTEIIFTLSGGTPWTQEYTLSGDTLTLVTNGINPYGAFIKQ